MVAALGHGLGAIPLRPRGEMADTRDLKSRGGQTPCRFESGRGHSVEATDGFGD